MVTQPDRLRVSGAAYVDLTDIPEDKQRHRLGRALEDTPAGARVVLYVGPLKVSPECVEVAQTYGRHIGSLEVLGHPFAVTRWVAALSEGAVIA